jgi:hypothetical protein
LVASRTKDKETFQKALENPDTSLTHAESHAKTISISLYKTMDTVGVETSMVTHLICIRKSKMPNVTNTDMDLAPIWKMLYT